MTSLQTNFTASWIKLMECISLGAAWHYTTRPQVPGTHIMRQLGKYSSMPLFPLTQSMRQHVESFWSQGSARVSNCFLCLRHVTRKISCKSWREKTYRDRSHGCGIRPIRFRDSPACSLSLSPPFYIVWKMSRSLFTTTLSALVYRITKAYLLSIIFSSWSQLMSLKME